MHETIDEQASPTILHNLALRINVTSWSDLRDWTYGEILTETDLAGRAMHSLGASMLAPHPFSTAGIAQHAHILKSHADILACLRKVHYGALAADAEDHPFARIPEPASLDIKFAAFQIAFYAGAYVHILLSPVCDYGRLATQNEFAQNVAGSAPQPIRHIMPQQVADSGQNPGQPLEILKQQIVKTMRELRDIRKQTKDKIFFVPEEETIFNIAKRVMSSLTDDMLEQFHTMAQPPPRRGLFRRLGMPES